MVEGEDSEGDAGDVGEVLEEEVPEPGAKAGLRVEGKRVEGTGRTQIRSRRRLCFWRGWI